jgi:nicotinate phosphoribosyltransferase
MVATKASRIVAAAQGKDVIEFGARRAHGPGAANLAARAAYIGGCVGTSNVEAGREYAIPTFGTMAHSFVMALEDESSAFQRYAELFPETSVMLIDTYDTAAAADQIVLSGIRPTGVRIDSGDLAELAREVRRRFDLGGLSHTKILLSGDLDEYKIDNFLAQEVPVDGFGVGTALVVSEDAPSLSGIYKLVETENDGKKNYHAKFSSEKATYPGTKQVYRFRESNGMFARDLIACFSERVQGGESLLQPVLRDGKAAVRLEPLQTIRERACSQLDALPAAVRRLSDPTKFDVRFSDELKRLRSFVQHEHVR